METYKGKGKEGLVSTETGTKKKQIRGGLGFVEKSIAILGETLA